MLTLIVAAFAWASPGLVQDLETSAGTPFSVEETLAKGPAVFVFWNSWLPGASEFVAVVGEVDRAAAARGWPGAVIVFQDDGESWVHGVGATGAGLPRVLDRRGELLRRFKVTRAPSVLVVGRQGEVLDRAGPDAGQVRALLAALAASAGSPR